MIRYLIIGFISIISLGSYAQTKYGYVPRNNSSSGSQTVYVCMGSYAYAYHSRSNCAGLGNCKADIKYTDEDYALNKLRRVPCCRCWSNVSNRCKDDNPPKTNYQSYYPSSYEFSRKQSNAILGFGSIVGIIPMLSNDIYALYAHSFKQSDKTFTRYDRFKRTAVPLNITSSEKNYHWVFGFRKTFDNSALEYGVSLSKTTDYFGDDLIYNYTLENKRFTYHLNFLKHLNFINIKNNRFNIYIGPSINYIGSDNIDLISGWDDYNWEDNYSKLGFGGIIGASYKLNHRLKLDTRFEQGTNTNRFQAGLIFTYQKEYVWEF